MNTKNSYKVLTALCAVILAGTTTKLLSTTPSPYPDLTSARWEGKQVTHSESPYTFSVIMSSTLSFTNTRESNTYG